MCIMSSHKKLRKTDMNGDARPDKRIKCAACKLAKAKSIKNPTSPLTIEDTDGLEHLEGDHGWGAHAIVNNSKAPAGSAFEFYRRFGYYWNYFPKTDYTYSPQSPYYKKEIIPGIPVIPNLSRRPVRPSSGSDTAYSGNLLSSSDDDSSLSSSPILCSRCSDGHRDRTRRTAKSGGVVSRVLREAFRVVVSTVTRTVTTVEEEEEEVLAAAAGTVVGLGAAAAARDMRSGRHYSANNSGAAGDASHLWRREPLSASTPLSVRRHTESSSSFTTSRWSSCAPCLLASLVAALVAILLGTLLFFPPEEINCSNGACESLAVADSSIWIWPEKFTLSNWPAWLSPAVWWTCITDWPFWSLRSNWDTSTPAAVPVPCIMEDCKTELQSFIRGALEQLSTLEGRLEKRMAGIEGQLSGQDQLTSIKIHTLKHQMSELKLQMANIEKAALMAKSQSGGNDIAISTVKDLTAYVDAAISKYHADRISLPDYALQSSGGEVISIRCTVGHKSSSAYYTLLGIPLAARTVSPDVALTPGTMPGDCWPFEGQTGSLVIRLSRKIKVTAFTIDHAPKEILPHGNFASAPKDFSVYGLNEINDKSPFLLGQFRFEKDGGSVQHYPALEADHPFQLVELAIHSNHGHMLYTCLYRFRVHGVPVDPEDWVDRSGPSL